ncbi:hypothetical protein [Pseudoalteromonas luteoviolacea]|uniref:Uncharacterized protein n=1 Tax=Pseudoalteromonas luteoviolacea S4060-1 TaxID=1365257 RepID=A0A167KUU1_9GAMM|nr:hypothetical protein [Pseudoalteromonas luteoviolacea]KZN63310.1 hypothetical protein N478_03410 [Pseudoalteromonas luteoviolacea S4060-1]
MSILISTSLLSLIGMWNVADCNTMEQKKPAGTAFIIQERRDHYAMRLLFVNNRFSRLELKKAEEGGLSFKNEKFTIELQKKGKGLAFSSWKSDGKKLETDNVCFIKKS